MIRVIRLDFYLQWRQDSGTVQMEAVLGAKSFPLSTNRQGQEKLLITDGKQYLMAYFPLRKKIALTECSALLQFPWLISRH
jgi:hypothetical protein